MTTNTTNDIINLTEILIGHEGDTFWNPLVGDVRYHHTDSRKIYFEFTCGTLIPINFDGTDMLGNPSIFPDRNQHDWLRYDMEHNKRRWRATKGDYYFYLDRRFIVKKTIENEDELDNTNYNIGNYFKTEEMAEEAKLSIRKYLYMYHKEHSITD